MRYGRYFVDGGVTGGKGEESTLPDAKMKMSLWRDLWSRVPSLWNQSYLFGQV